jgi:hypothetical protein
MGWAGSCTLIACGLAASTARKRRRSRPRWSRRPSLFEMAKASILAYRATRSWPKAVVGQFDCGSREGWKRADSGRIFWE